MCGVVSYREALPAPIRCGEGLSDGGGSGCCGPEVAIDSQGTRHAPPILRHRVCHRYDATHMPVANIAQLLAVDFLSHPPNTTHTHTHTLARAHIAECCSGVAARCCTTTRMAVPALQGWKMMLIDRTVLQFYNSNTYSVFSHPGGHFICRPPITWTCKWYTLCPPAAPSFTTIRYPSFDSPSFFATCPATTIRWPSMSRWRASA